MIARYSNNNFTSNSLEITKIVRENDRGQQYSVYNTNIYNTFYGSNCYRRLNVRFKKGILDDVELKQLSRIKVNRASLNTDKKELYLMIFDFELLATFDFIQAPKENPNEFGGEFL